MSLKYAESKKCESQTLMSSDSTAELSYITVAQLAQRLQVSESTIYAWVDRDYIPFLMASDLVRFDPTAIHEWMLAEADRKREKKRVLRAVRRKVASAPGGCNRKGAIG
jgi:excisionase family DNA binding protein